MLRFALFFEFAVEQFSCSSRVRFAGLFLGCLAGLFANGCVFCGVWYCVLFCCAPCLCLLLVHTFGFVVLETVFAWIADCGLIALLIVYDCFDALLGFVLLVV